jgi:hypothetical protein
LDQEGGIKNIYTGHPDVNHENKLFCPTGIVTTPSDKFVVADLYVHIIYILSSDGGILTYHNTETVGVELPSSLHYYNLSTSCDWEVWSLVYSPNYNFIIMCHVDNYWL